MKTSKFALIGALITTGLLAGCGKDPPENPQPVVANPADPAAAQSANVPSGVKLVPVTGPVTKAENGNAKCNLERIAGQDMEAGGTEVSLSSSVQVEGWYFDPAKGTNGDPLSVVIDSADLSMRWTAMIPERSERGDVDESQQGGGKYTKSGLNIALNLSTLPAGSYGIYLDGSAGPCSVGRVFSTK